MGVSSELVTRRKADVHTSQTASKKAKEVEYSLDLVSVGASGRREKLAILFRHIDLAFLCDGTHLGGAAERPRVQRRFGSGSSVFWKLTGSK